MLGPLVILALLSIGGGFLGKGEGLGKIDAFLAPTVGAYNPESATPHLELILSVVAVAVALLGWLIAYLLYGGKTQRAARVAAAFPAGYKLLENKYYVDEIYNAIFVKGLLGFSKYLLNFVIDAGILGGTAWLLGGIANLSGAILQRWQSGNLRSYAAWLAAGAAAVLILFVVLPAMLHSQGFGSFWLRH
jgi:NADH-quinone oxidoreductase subunit L